VTDGQKDGIDIASTALAMRAFAERCKKLKLGLVASYDIPP